MAQTVELPRPAGPDSELGGHWRVIVRNDDHNTFDHVAHTLARHIPGVSVSKGYAIADLIHNQGQAVVWSGMKEPAELYWELLQGRGAHDGSARAGVTSSAPVPARSTRSCQT